MSYYNAKVQIDGDDTALQNKINHANTQAKQVDNKVDSITSKISQIWNYGMHVTNLIIANLSRVAQTEEQATRLRSIQQGLSITQTELSIVYTGYRAAVAFQTGQIVQGASLLFTAGLMQTLLIQQQVQLAEQKRLEAYQKNVTKFYEMYR